MLTWLPTQKTFFLPGRSNRVKRALYTASVIILLFLLHGTASGQYRIPFINYTMKNGLIQNQVRDICQDHKGYIWFATADGISRFDGKSFTGFTVADGLPVNTVTDMLVDRKNRLWLATYGGGLTVYNGQTFHTYTVDDGLCSNNLIVSGFNDILMEDSRGGIWCRTYEEGISVVRGNTVTTYNKNNGLANNSVICFVEDRQGRILCGTASGISVIDGENITNHSLGKETSIEIVSNIIINDEGIWAISQNSEIVHFSGDRSVVYSLPERDRIISCESDSENTIWLTTINGGLYSFKGKKFTQVIHPEEYLKKVFEDRNRNIWLLTMGNGVYRLNKDGIDSYNRQYGLIDNNVNCIFEDEEGNIWIGTDSGVSMYGKVIFETLTAESGLPNDHIMSVAAGPEGDVWCGPLNSGLIRVKGKQINQYVSEQQDNLAINTLISMAFSGNKLLLGSFGAGLGYFHNGKLIFKDYKEEEEVYSILCLSENEYWAATSGGLLHVFNGHKKYYTTEDGLADNSVYFLASDHKKRIWCTTMTSGLSVFDGEKFINYTTDDGLPNNSCTDIAVDKSGSVWVGTENGLCRITEENGTFIFKTYTTRDGLASASVNVVHADESDCLWIGYVNGLNTINLNSGEIRYYGEDDGYDPLDCYRGAAATDSEGKVWFGTVAGLVRYNPEADIKRSGPPRTYITGITLSDGEDITPYADSISHETGLPVGLSLPHNRNTIRIDWIGIHFTVPAKNKYRFILEGYEKNWHEASSETFREYQLSRGHYTFRVMACNNDGVWNPTPVSYSFSVRPPWWATIVAYIAYAIILLILIYLYVKWRERALIEKNRMLEEKVYERTLEIELQKQNIEEINEELKQHQEELIVQRDMAAAQRDQIDEQRREIMDSIHYAKRIQTAIMPTPDVMNRIIPGHFLFFRPRDIVSGDYYWAAKKGNKAVVVAADCTGHGVPGAFMSMLGISILNEIVMKQEVEKASEILEELRTNLKAILFQRGAEGEQRDGMDLALCMIDYEKREVQYAGAYNPLYLVRKGELTEYKADKMPVGIHVGIEKDFTNHTVGVEPGDMLYIFSDGYIDQFGGENDTKFKAKPFKQLLIDISGLPLEQQKEKLVSTHDQWKGDGKQIDDIIVMGIRVES